MRYPDGTLDWQPANHGKPDFAAFMVRRADDSLNHGSYSARQKIEEQLKAVLLPDDFWKQCEVTWLKNEYQDARKRREKARDELIAQDMRIARYASLLGKLEGGWRDATPTQ
jgi:hypothetical protein